MFQPSENVPIQKGDLSEIYDRIDSLAYAIKTRGEELENLSHRIYGQTPIPAETNSQARVVMPTPLEEIRTRLNDCFFLIESLDHHIKTLSRL